MTPQTVPGFAIRHWRKLFGWRQEDLAIRANVSVAKVSTLENGYRGREELEQRVVNTLIAHGNHVLKLSDRIKSERAAGRKLRGGEWLDQAEVKC